MWLLGRAYLILSLLVFGLAGLKAADPPNQEERAFVAISEAFGAGFWQRVDAEAAQFVAQFTNSARIPEVMLLQGQSRIQLTNYTGAIELLAIGQTAAGTLTDQYQFWLAEAYYRKGDFQAAADQFARLVREQPTSSRRLEAVIAEATSRSKADQWDQVIDLLQATNGLFQASAQATPTNGLVVRGMLLLGESHFTKQDYTAAEKILSPLIQQTLHPRLEWRLHHLLCRLYLAQSRPAEALQATTNLLAVAPKIGQPNLTADSAVFQASVFQRLARLEDAIRSYERNLAEGVSPDYQQQALLRIAELAIALNDTPRAVATLERFVDQWPQASGADLAWLSLGDLRLKRHLEASLPGGAAANVASTNVPGATNLLQQAAVAFQNLSTNFPQSAYSGKAQLNLGWCYWLESRWAESRAAFQAAVERLPTSMDLATAHFKLADAQYQLGDYTNALKNYSVIQEKFSGISEVRTNLLERSLYQVIHAGRAAGQLPPITSALATILSQFPNGFLADRALVLAGSEVSRRGNPAAARDVFLWVMTNSPSTNLQPQLQLAVARTYEQETNWPAVIGQYDSWLAVYTNHPALPRAQYDWARASAQAGSETNALYGFTNLIHRFPTHELTPMAQWWEADYYFRTGEYLEAEKKYQLLSRSTNWPTSRLTFEAQMMAGRAAMARLSWEQAKDYFLGLYNDTNGPTTDLRVQALFSYGDYWISRDSTNKLADFDEAISVFNGILTRHPTNRLAVLALGKVASCYLQKAQSSTDLELARTNFLQVIASPVADVAARSIATVGLAVVAEKQALDKPAPEQKALREKALSHYLDVFYNKILRDGEVPDLFWVKKSGLDAAELAIALQEWSSAIGVYQQLQSLLPQLRPRLEKNIARARDLQARQP